MKMSPHLHRAVITRAGLLVALAMCLMKFMPAIPGHFTMYEWLALVIWIVLGVIVHRRRMDEKRV